MRDEGGRSKSERRFFQCNPVSSPALAGNPSECRMMKEGGRRATNAECGMRKDEGRRTKGEWRMANGECQLRREADAWFWRWWWQSRWINEIHYASAKGVPFDPPCRNAVIPLSASLDYPPDCFLQRDHVLRSSFSSFTSIRPSTCSLSKKGTPTRWMCAATAGSMFLP